MQPLTCVVVGAGYAGINAVKAIQKSFSGEASAPPLRLILVDKHPYHLRKVLLFKPAAGEDDITIPLARLFPAGVEFVQATVTEVATADKTIRLRDSGGHERSISYDRLVLALGSVVRQPESDRGGIPLASLDAARKIREAWRTNLQQAITERDARVRQRLMTIAVAGAGLSGMETSAELAHAVREDAAAMGLDPHGVTIRLINANERLFPEGPAKVGHKLERLLAANGVTVLHGRQVLQEKEGIVSLSGGETMPVGLCVWTLGLLPNPALPGLGVPLTPDGHVMVDACYRVQGLDGVYSIGDCARIVDPARGRADSKTCKEATGQAARLGRIMLADVVGRPAPQHKAFMDFFCFHMGPEQALVWTRQWGLDFLITGKLGAKIRKLTWNTASLLSPKTTLSVEKGGKTDSSSV